MAFGMYVIMYFISPFGKEAIAAFGIGMRIEQIFLMPIIGLNIAILSILSQNNGAKLYDRIEPTVILALKMGWIFSFVGVASFFLMSDFLASLLTSDVRVIEQTTLYLRICGLSSFAFVVIFMYIAMLQSIKKPNIIMPVSIYRQILAPAFFFSILFYFKVEIFYYWITLDFIIFSSSIYIWWYSKEKLNELRVMI
jgi:Na+-driven multidrug efflux pump